MNNQIKTIAIERLLPHPDNPNRMSKVTFARLVRNIERTGRYEPIVVRPFPYKDCNSCTGRNPDDNNQSKGDCYQIINGHHRVRALRQLGIKTADVVIWDVDDHETNIMLATLNRLAGSDVLKKKLALLRLLNNRVQSRELAKLLPYRAKQIERLNHLKLLSAPAKIEQSRFLIPMTFFVNDKQHKTIRLAMSLVQTTQKKATKARQNAAALTRIAEQFIENHDNE